MAYIVDDIINAIGAAQAAQKQEAAANQAMGVQRDVYNQSRQDQQPYMDAGRQTLGDLLGQMQAGGFNTTYNQLNPADIANDPGYQFRMQQGQQALERSAAARGGLNSGGFMKGLANYSQGLASTEYNNAFNRNLQSFQAQQSENQGRFGRLYQLAGMGQNSAQNLGALGQGYANSMGQLYGALGNAQAAGIMGITNGISGAVRGGVNIGLAAMGDPLPLMTGGGGGGGNGIPMQSFNLGGGIPTQGSYMPASYGQAPQGFNPSSPYPYFGGGK